MSANIHHNNYKLMYSEALEQIKKLKRMYQDEKLRADLLQKDLDAIDDFQEITESAIANSLRNNSIN